MAGRPICPLCKRAVRKGRDYRLIDGFKAHPEGECVGPYAKHWFVIGYDGDQPRYIGRLADNKHDLEVQLNEIPDGLEIRLRKMNLAQLGRVHKRMGI